MSQTMARPEGLAAPLFSLRAAQLVHNADTITLRAACLVC
jgi:2-dehydro-3-deoxygalactonokinase